jgi:hypothetical protein
MIIDIIFVVLKGMILNNLLKIYNMNTIILISVFALVIIGFVAIGITGWNNMQNNGGKSPF